VDVQPRSRPTFSLHYEGLDTGLTAAMFLSEWDVLFDNPVTTG
jgi:hypothetical protein